MAVGGRGWRSPNPSPLSNDLQVVKANTPEDVWAEGEYLNLPNHQHRLFVIHWDGSRWSTVKPPARIARQVQLCSFWLFDPVGATKAFALAGQCRPEWGHQVR